MNSLLHNSEIITNNSPRNKSDNKSKDLELQISIIEDCNALPPEHPLNEIKLIKSKIYDKKVKFVELFLKIHNK